MATNQNDFTGRMFLNLTTTRKKAGKYTGI